MNARNEMIGLMGGFKVLVLEEKDSKGKVEKLESIDIT
jgi:hypothetical protein